MEEKRRFRKAPINYAMTKNELFKEIVIKIFLGDWLIFNLFRKWRKMKKILKEKMN